MPISPSGKIPAHDPKSPAPQERSPLQCMEGSSGSTDTRPSFVPVQVVGREGHGADVESTKEGRMPTLVTQEAEKSTLQHVVESTKKARMPTQVTPEAEKSTLGHVVESTKEARIPIQVTAAVKKSFSDLSETKNAKERPILESQNPQNSLTDTRPSRPKNSWQITGRQGSPHKRHQKQRNRLLMSATWKHEGKACTRI